MRRGLLHAHDVVDLHAFAIRKAKALERLALHLFAIADDVIDVGHLGEQLGIDLGGAAGHDDLGLRPFATQLADGLLGLTDRFTCHGAGVDDHRVIEARRLRVLAHNLGLVGVETAAQGDDNRFRH